MAQADLYVSLSAQVALERRMDTIANNIANMNTAGFRADGVKFDTVLDATGNQSVAYASGGTDYITRQAGAMNQTGNPLDVAVGGDGWFSLQTPAGQVYTRDGRFHLNDLGELRSVNNYEVLDPGGGPITLDTSAGPPEIGADGGISQGGKRVGAIGLFLLPDKARLSHYDNSAVLSTVPGAQAEDLTVNSMHQGYVEGANVNPVVEMTRLISVSRAFDNAVAAIQQSDSRSEETIRALGPAG